MFAYFGHHKCASHWLTSIVRHVCQEINLPCTVIHGQDLSDAKAGYLAVEKKMEFLVYTNSMIRHVERLSNYRGFHVVRDPRDIMVSAYFSHLYSHPTDNWPQLIEHRTRLQRVSLFEGLFLEMDFNRNILDDLYQWDYHRPHIKEMRMEDIILSPYDRLVEAFSFLGLVSPHNGCRQRFISLVFAILKTMSRRNRGRIPNPFFRNRISMAELLFIIHANRFEVRTKGRRPGQEDRMHHYRRGVAGDWVNYFEPAHSRYFKEQYNHVLLKLGYETDEDW